MILAKISIIVLGAAIIIVPCIINGINAQQTFRDRNFLQTESNPSVTDPSLKVELVVSGIGLTLLFQVQNEFYYFLLNLSRTTLEKNIFYCDKL